VFEYGRVYNRRREIHGPFGGQQQGGIITPRNHPFIILVTGEAGEAHGYQDHYREDGTFWYTGEGQRGDMQWVRGNLSVRDHINNGKALYLFRDEGSGSLRCEGEFRILGHHTEERPDTEGATRSAIIFELESLVGAAAQDGATQAEPRAASRLWSMEDNALKLLATLATSRESKEVERRVRTRLRAEAIRVFARRRAAGVCEACACPAPFNDIDGRPFLEVHHIDRLSDGGPDDPERVAAICPNCHRNIHFGKLGSKINEVLRALRSRG
jgi:5-methylcytosine-specific restriction enzyme A